MADNLQVIAYGQTTQRWHSRRGVRIALLLLLLPIGGYGLWTAGQPYYEQWQYLNDAARWEHLFYPADTVIHSTDPDVVAVTGESGSLYGPDGKKLLQHFDREHPAVPGVWSDRAYPQHCAVSCLLRSPGGMEQIVRVGTATQYHFIGAAFTNREIWFVSAIANRATWRPGSRQTWDAPSYSTPFHIQNGMNDRLTIYAGKRMDAGTILLPYRLNDRPGEFLVRLNDDGTLSVSTTGPAELTGRY